MTASTGTSGTIDNRPPATTIGVMAEHAKSTSPLPMTALDGLVLGSVASYLAQHSLWPVAVLPSADRNPLDELEVQR